MSLCRRALLGAAAMAFAGCVALPSVVFAETVVENAAFRLTVGDAAVPPQLLVVKATGEVVMGTGPSGIRTENLLKIRYIR